MTASANRGRRRTWLLGLLLTALALPAGADPVPCARMEIGSVIVAENGLRVIEPAVRGLAAGDVLEQLNSHELHTCADLAAALREARERGLALLFLVVRDQQRIAVFALWPRAAAVAAPATPAVESTPTPVAVSPRDSEVVGDMLSRLVAFGQTLQASLPVLTTQPWASRIGDLQQACAEGQAHTPAVGVLAPILAYYRTVAEILRYKEKAEREAGYTRPQPNVVLDYHSGPPVGTWMHRYPFLRESIVEHPGPSLIGGESNGRWSPDQAVRLLVERALADAAALRRRLDGEGAG